VDKLIISVAVTGGSYGRDDSPYLPISSSEIADSAVDAFNAGAAIAHIHVRDEEGKPCHDLERYGYVVDSIRARCDMIMNLTTDLRLKGGLSSLKLAPEIASFPCGSANLGEVALCAPPAILRDLAKQMQAVGTKPELEIFHDGMIGQAIQFDDQGLLEQPLFFQFLLGISGGSPADPHTLLRLVDSLPAGAKWTVSGAGLAGTPMATLGIMLGGHVTVGLEGQLFYAPGELATSNAQLVERIVRLAGELGREVATAGEARSILGLNATRQKRPNKEAQ